MPKISEAAKESRRAHILGAAVRCFARRGYYATTIEDVVVESGLSRGALYLYFPSKETLYLAISEQWNCGMEGAVKARLTPDMSPAAILRLLIEINGEHVQAESEACRVLMEGWSLSHTIPELEERLQRQQVRSLRNLSQLLRAGVEAGELRADLDVETQARMLRATLHGLMVQWHQQPGSVDWQRVAQAYVQGLRAR